LWKLISFGLPCIGIPQVDSHYVDIKALNPNLPFLVRAVDDVAPNVVATYGTEYVLLQSFAQA